MVLAEVENTDETEWTTMFVEGETADWKKSCCFRSALVERERSCSKRTQFKRRPPPPFPPPCEKTTPAFLFISFVYGKRRSGIPEDEGDSREVMVIFAAVLYMSRQNVCTWEKLTTYCCLG